MLTWLTRFFRKAPPPTPAPKVDPSYLRAGRRLLRTPAHLQAEGQHCHTCKHNIAYVTWWCERQGQSLPCQYEPAYIESELTPQDIREGDRLQGGWLRVEGFVCRVDQPVNQLTTGESNGVRT